MKAYAETALRKDGNDSKDVDMADRRARTMSVDDLLRLMLKFNKAGIHFA